MSITEIKAAILTVQTIEELQDLTDALRARWNTLQTAKAQTAMVQFKRGDIVKFGGKRGVTEVGKIKDFNTKSVSVDAADGRSWRVGASMLERATQEEFDAAAKRPAWPAPVRRSFGR